MKVTLLDHTVDPELKIGLSAAICYDAKTDYESCKKRARHCRDKGHLSTLRFAYATFAIEDISRVCSHQLVRMAHAGILQESQRYVNQSNAKFVTPPAIAKLCLPDHFSTFQHHMERSLEMYDWYIQNGIKKEDARYVLPAAFTTKVNLCLNFQGWRDFLKNRESPTAQWEIREVAEEIHNHLSELAPGIFGDWP